MLRATPDENSGDRAAYTSLTYGTTRPDATDAADATDAVHARHADRRPCAPTLRFGQILGAPLNHFSDQASAAATSQPSTNAATIESASQVLEIRYELDDVIASGDSVAIRATAHGRNNLAPVGIEPTGRPYAMKTAHFFRGRDGRHSEHWGIHDELDVLFQVGALQPPTLHLPTPE